MSKVVFYKQVREDGGVRIGIEVNDLTCFEQFDSGGDDSDPALVWFADVRCQGKGLPADPEKARAWLLANAASIRHGISTLAADLRAGIDVESYPLQRRITPCPRHEHLAKALEEMCGHFLESKEPADGKPRQLGACLIQAIANRLKYQVRTFDKRFPR